MKLDGFNADAVEPMAERTLIPAGWYKIAFIEATEVANKAGTGSYLQLVAEILEGQQQGRKYYERLNLNNPNEMAVALAQRTLSGICRSINVRTPKHSSDLLNRPLMAKVVVKEPSAKEQAAGYTSAKNEIVEYGEAEGAAKPAASNLPPWKR